MSKVLVLYYSSYGHIEAMATAVGKGAKEAGAQVDIKRVPELVPDKVARDSHYKMNQTAPVALLWNFRKNGVFVLGDIRRSVDQAVPQSVLHPRA